MSFDVWLGQKVPFEVCWQIGPRVGRHQVTRALYLSDGKLFNDLHKEKMWADVLGRWSPQL